MYCYVSIELKLLNLTLTQPSPVAVEHAGLWLTEAVGGRISTVTPHAHHSLVCWRRTKMTVATVIAGQVILRTAHIRTTVEQPYY